MPDTTELAPTFAPLPILVPGSISEKPNRCVISHFHPLRANHRTEADRYSFADPISLQSVNENLDEPRPQPVQKDGAERNTRLF